jgi:hypothetical protein
LNRKPVIIVNTKGYFDPIIQMLEKSITSKFLDKPYWFVCKDSSELVSTLRDCWNKL